MDKVRLVRLRGVPAIEHAIHTPNAKLFLEASLLTRQRELAIAESFLLVQKGREDEVFTWRLEAR